METNTIKENKNTLQISHLISSQTNSINTQNENSKQEINIDYDNNDLLLSKIFKLSEKNKETIPELNTNSYIYLKKLIAEIPSFDNIEKLYLFILKKIEFFNKLKKIVDNSYELLYIMFDYLSSYDLSPFNYFIELYIKYILLLNNKLDTDNELKNKNKTFLLEKINIVLSWFISCGLIKKNNIDFSYQKIAEFQLYNELTIKLFTDLIPLIEIIYGSNCDYSLVNSFIAKKYIYLYDKENSKIMTNVTQNNPLIIEKGFNLLMWFYLNNHESNQCTLCQIQVDGDNKVEFVLNENFDIDIKYNSSTIFKEKDNKFFRIKQKKWTQLKIQINKNEIKLILMQRNNGDKNTEKEIKTYLTTHKKKNEKDNKNYIDFQNSNFIITSLEFYVGFVGIASYIIFCKSANNKTLDSLQLEQNLKIRDFLQTKNILPEIYFIFDPNFYFSENNKFIYSFNNKIDKFRVNPTNIDQLNLNSVLNFRNYTKNIYYLGGCNNILPLFEILYKFSINYNLTENDIIAINLIFQRLIKLMEIIFINKRKNCIEVCKYEIDFFESLRLFLEKINEKFYTINNENLIINSLINIGTYFSSLISKNELNENEPYGLFNNILFNPKIIIKFSPEYQKELIKFFIKIQKENINLLMKMENVSILLLFISKRCYQKYDFKVLFDYIKILFENNNISDNKRESLFLLYSDEKISDEIFIYIIQIFCDYFKIKNDNDELKNKKEISIKTILSNNFFIENLLYFFSNTNIQIKKAILNFIFILAQEYNTVLEEYFNQVVINNKRNNNGEINKRITKEEFFNFIQENILPEFNNIKEENENKNDSQIKKSKNITNISSKVNNLNNYTINSNTNNKNESSKKNNKFNILCISSNKESIMNFNGKRSKSEENNKIKNNSNFFTKYPKTNFKINIYVKTKNTKNNNDYLSELIDNDYIKNNTSNNKNFDEDNNPTKIIPRSLTSLNEDLLNEKYEKSVSNFRFNDIFSFQKETTPKNYSKPKTKYYNYRKKSMDYFKLNQISRNNLNAYDKNEEVIKVKAKCEILLTLSNWLICLTNTEINTNIEELFDWVINLLIKFICNSNELEVIYKALFVIFLHKSLILNNHKTDGTKIKESYTRLLYYFANNKNFILLLEELTIFSYIGKLQEESKNDYSKNLLSKFKFINDSLLLRTSFKNEKEYFEKIYEMSYGLLIEILSSKLITSKNDIINNIFNIIIKLSGILQNKKDKILFEFLNKLFFKMYVIYNNELISLKNGKEREILLENYIGLLSIYCSYSLINNITSYYLNNKSNFSFKINNIIPPYLISGILYDKEKSDFTSYLMYDKIINELKVIFSVNEILKLFNIKSNIKDYNENKTIIKYNSKTVDKLVEYLIKNQQSNLIMKNKFESLFKTFQKEKNNIELIYIVSLFYNNCLYILFSEIKGKEKLKIKLIKLLNDFQNYIIFLLLICCNVGEEEQIKQSIIFCNLVICIKNIISRINNNDYGQYFTDSFCNILNVISKIYLLKTSNTNSLMNIFSKNINLENNATIQLIDYYIKLDEDFFNKKNFCFFAQNIDNENGVKLIEENKKILFGIFSKSNSLEINNKNTDISITFKRFDNIYNEKLNIIKEMKFLMINKNIENNDNETDEIYYQNLFYKINKLKTPYTNTNKIKNFQRQFFAIKNYKKLKKFLYSFNNSYSNLPIFYPDKINSYSKKNKSKLLKYKISNFLSKDMTRKFLSPIIDLNNYILNFRSFDYKENNIYHHSKDKIYTVDLNIFPNFSTYPLIPNNSNQNDLEKYFIIENICYIKTTHHVSGIIFIEKNSNSCFYFCIKELQSHNILVSTKSDYDSRNKACFGSLFRNNKNKKDINVYIKINFKDIIFIFNRKYCFRDNSIEIYLTNHRSYYFKFESKEKRTIFVDYILNTLNKKLFKTIKSIDRNNKTVILGYYKDIENNKDYSNINEIKENWKNNKISTLEYLMWINIYGNRSFRDIAQYPVFPWILNNYDFNTDKELYKNFDNIKRDFNTPMGMSAYNEQSQQRRINYICYYKNMINDLCEMGFDFVEIKENSEEKVSNNSNNNIDNNKNNKLLTIPKYEFNIEDLFNDKDLDIDNIPYFYNTHYSNAAYVSHYLIRLFPYSLNIIEIQSNGFDYPARLFLCLKRAFNSATSNKGDLRELIPEFFTIPEMFLNLNRFNFGKIDTREYNGDLDEMKEIENIYISKENDYENKITDNGDNLNSYNNENIVNIEDVILPKWCSKNPFLFIQKYREFLEKSRININPWIDLIFGCCQRGIKAQNIGNIYMAHAYDGVIENRIKEEDIIKNREKTGYDIGHFDLGVNPTKVFGDQLKESKEIIQQIPIIKEVDQLIPFFDINQILNNSKVKYIKNINNSFNDIFIIDDKFSAHVFTIKNTITNEFIKESFYTYKDIKIKDIIEINPIFANLIIKTICNEKITILAGFYDGSIYIIDRNMKLNNKEKNYYEISNKLNDENKNLLNIFGKGLITTLEISKDEKYLVYGTNKGTIVIFSLDFFNDNNQIDLLKIIPSHIGYKINSIYISSDLNVFGDCAYDGYVHLYTLPNCKLINSIYIKNYFIDYIFLSAQPLASIILYSNINNTFKCYNINGHDLEVKQSDKIYNNTQKIISVDDEKMTSPIVFTDYQFIDFLLYIFGDHFIILRKMPSMEIVFRIDIKNAFLSIINISLCKKYIYAIEKNYNKIYIIETKKNNQTNQNKLISK